MSDTIQSDYRVAFGTPQGERVFRNLLERCNLFGTVTAPNGDMLRTAFEDGRRSVVLEIIAMLGPEREERMTKSIIDLYHGLDTAPD